ncbi:MAG: hypothetical protein JWM98_1947 [Thermoleophilia bacterium]|nr:hypothetical protein [Thermoleophilia bacterium]
MEQSHPPLADDEPDEPAAPHERRDAEARAGDLDAMARSAQDATFGTTDGSRTVVPGVLSGDVGPKGQISAQMRANSRKERATYGEVPPGSVAGGSGKVLLLPMLAIGFGLIALVVLVGWLAR